MTRKSRCTVRKQREMNAGAQSAASFFLYPSSGNGTTNITVGLPPQLPQSRKSLSDSPEIYLCGESKGYQIAIEVNYHTVNWGRGEGQSPPDVRLTFSSVNSSPSQQAQWGLWPSENKSPSLAFEYSWRLYRNQRYKLEIWSQKSKYALLSSFK